MNEDNTMNEDKVIPEKNCDRIVYTVIVDIPRGDGDEESGVRTRVRLRARVSDDCEHTTILFAKALKRRISNTIDRAFELHNEFTAMVNDMFGDD